MKTRTFPISITVLTVIASIALSACSRQQGPYTISTENGLLTLTPLLDNALRVSFSKTDVRPLPEVIYIEKHNAPPYTVETNDSVVFLSTKKLKVAYYKNQDVLEFFDKTGNSLLREIPHSRQIDAVQIRGSQAYSVSQSFDSPADEFLFGTGQFQDGYLNVKGLTRRLTQVNTQISLPMVISNKPYALLWNNTGMTDFNPADSCLVLENLGALGKSETVNATGTLGNRRETRFQSFFGGTLSVPESGRYCLLLDVGQKMARRHHISLDGKAVIDMSNMWLPPTSSVIVDLEAGSHSVSVEGVRGDQPKVYWRKVTDKTTFSSPVAQSIDYTFFAGNADQSICSYRKLTGAVPPMPDWMFGYIHCRERYHSQDEILTTAKKFQDSGIPLDVIVQDWQWWGSTGWNSMQFDPANYPDPKSLTDSLHKLGVKFMLSVWSKVDRSSELGQILESKNSYIPDTDWIDFFNQETAREYWNSFRDSLVTPYGIDVWWLDATEPENDDLESRMVDKGSLPGEFYRNAYPLFVLKTMYEGMKRDCPEREPVILTRSAFPGIQRYGAITWSGDVGNDFKTLKYQIAGGLGQMAAGVPWWTYDAGGFFRPADQYSNEQYQERMLRWIQTSVFLPFMRVHGYMSDTEPWNYSPETCRIFTNCIKLRKLLQPYLVDCAEKVSSEGYTLMRPLVFDFPSDVEALKQDSEFMLGPALLVSPVLESGVDNWQSYLPENPNGWIDLRNGNKYKGGQYLTTDVDMEMIPVFVSADKAGQFKNVMKYLKTK